MVLMNKKELSAVFLIISLLISCVPNEKEVLISYTIYVDGGDELINCLKGYGQPNFILYDDGQLVVYRNGQYFETTLPQDEVNSLLENIESTGVLSLGKVEIEGFDQLIVQGKVYHFPRPNFPNKSIEQTVNIINQFQPSNLKPYKPKNLLLWIYPVESLKPFEDVLPKPIPQAKNWSSELDPLSEFHVGFRDVFGETVPRIIKQFDGFPDYQIFKERDILYVTAICARFDGFGSYLTSEP